MRDRSMVRRVSTPIVEQFYLSVDHPRTSTVFHEGVLNIPRVVGLTASEIDARVKSSIFIQVVILTVCFQRIIRIFAIRVFAMKEI